MKADGARFFRFLMVGGVNTLFGYGLFALLVWIGVFYPVAIALATVAGVLFNFQTTGRWVFRDAGSSNLWRFAGAYLVIYCVNIAAVALLIRTGISVYLANAIAIPPLVCLSYLLQRTFVFSRP